MVTVIHDARETALPQARAQAQALWLTREEIERATGWAWKPEGLCRDDTCVPLPPAREGRAPMVEGDRLDLAALWRHAGWPVAQDSSSQWWVLGEGAERRAQALASLEAPDFELPDLAGRRHRLRDFRGRRVYLATWASW